MRLLLVIKAVRSETGKLKVLSRMLSAERLNGLSVGRWARSSHTIEQDEDTCDLYGMMRDMDMIVDSSLMQAIRSFGSGVPRRRRWSDPRRPEMCFEIYSI